MEAIRKLFAFLEENYNDEIIVQLGDSFDSTGLHYDLIEEFINQTKKIGKHWFIIKGNHDESYVRGGILQPLKHYDHFTIINEKTELEIEGMKCLFLPYTHKAKEEYENIQWKGSACFLHVTNKEDEFASEGIETKSIDALQIFGHTHTHKEYTLKNGNHKIIAGVPLPTRNGETVNNLIQITNEGMKYINHGIDFGYEDIEYGSFPKNKDNILNVKKAPSVVSVCEMYKDYYIRTEGIELLLDSETENGETFTFDVTNIKQSYIDYGKEKAVNTKVIDRGVNYL